ncbi:hypothetical protein O181_032996 [Austropuccinia psidii MF-1]|uniref:Uncharacterized protein n=1 Tax=Austropuccinia psidii MF-1 TaxID=1389203 RepID=A0A9Q3D3I2_9BASI|nr:hypothetical protein [Austropuccinia psidii MF-1]
MGPNPWPTVHILRSVGPLGPLSPKSNEAKRGQGVANHPPHHMTKIDEGSPVGHYSAHGLWQPPETTSSAKSKDSPQFHGNTFPFSMHPVLKDPGVVHIWYNIPLCTIFSQKSNRDTFRTKLSDSKSSTQSITNFEGGFFSYSIWQFPGGYQKTIQGPQPPGSAGLGLSILISTILREILRGYQSFPSFSRQQVLSIPWTTQLVHTGSNKASCMALAHLAQFIFHCVNSVTQFNSQDGHKCIGPIQTIQPGDSPYRIILSAFHIHWPPFITWGPFPQLINILDL